MELNPADIAGIAQSAGKPAGANVRVVCQCFQACSVAVADDLTIYSRINPFDHQWKRGGCGRNCCQRGRDDEGCLDPTAPDSVWPVGAGAQAVGAWRELGKR